MSNSATTNNIPEDQDEDSSSPSAALMVGGGDEKLVSKNAPSTKEEQLLQDQKIEENTDKVVDDSDDKKGEPSLAYLAKEKSNDVVTAQGLTKELKDDVDTKMDAKAKGMETEILPDGLEDYTILDVSTINPLPSTTNNTDAAAVALPAPVLGRGRNVNQVGPGAYQAAIGAPLLRNANMDPDALVPAEPALGRLEIPAPSSYQQQELLFEATLVDEEGGGANNNNHDTLAVFTAEPISNRKWKCAIAGLLGLVLLSAVLGVTCGLTGECSRNKEGDTSSPSEWPSESPTISNAPTASPTPYVLANLPEFSIQALQQENSSQWRAYRWVANDPLLLEYSNDRLLQRFALASIYYATGGDTDWNVNDNWLSYDQHECLWFTKFDPLAYPEHDGNPCDETQQWYRLLTQWDNGAKGTIPPEIGLLT